MSVGCRSGVHWIRANVDAVDRLRDRARQDRLRRSGHVLEQHVPAGDQRRQDQRDLIVLADDDPFDVRKQPGRRLEDGEPLAGLRGLSSYHCD